MGLITINSRKLFTLNPDGTELKELTYSAEWNQNRIGEYKKVVIEFSSTQDLADSIIYFNPALYIGGGVNIFTTGNIPTEGFSYVVDPSATMGDYPMVPFVNVGYAVDLVKNWEAEIHIGYGDDFKITFKYFQDEDRSGFLSTISQYNHDKLLKDRIANPSELSVVGNSVYTNPEYTPRFYVCQVDIIDATIKSYIQNNFSLYKAGFYNKNAHETAPYFTNPVWTLSDSGGNRPTFTLLEDTLVDFFVECPATPSTWLTWIIRTDKIDNTVDFYTNYEASFHKVLNNAGTGTLNNKIKAPSTALVLSSGITFRGTFHIDKTLLTEGAKYRFISIVYNVENDNVNSFISDEYEVALPSFDGQGYTFVSKIRDYFNDWYGNKLTCTIEERLQSITNVNYSYFGFSDDILNRLGLVVPNDIRRYLTKITVEIYDQPSAQLRQYYDRVTAYKTGPTSYSIPTNMGLNFTTDNLEVKYLFRNRYEADVDNIESTFNGLIILPTTTQNWGGKTLKIKTTLELYYDDYVIPFTDALEFIQEIIVKDYVTTGLFVYNDGTQVKPAATDYYCSDEAICFDAYLSSGAYAGFRLLTTIEKETGNIGTIEENEELSGVLPQLSSPKILTQEVSFGDTSPNRANFCLQPTEMIFDVFYKVCAIAKKLIP